jgi:hypothetical protein
MAKHGHVKGQGLGASSSGISQPLMMERVKAPKAPKAPKGSEAEAPKGAKGMGIGGKAMGRLVNANAEEKNRAELEKYGESSRIVVLTNMVGVEDVDEDLQTEIGTLVSYLLKVNETDPWQVRNAQSTVWSSECSCVSWIPHLQIREKACGFLCNFQDQRVLGRLFESSMDGSSEAEQFGLVISTNSDLQEGMSIRLCDFALASYVTPP